jgi:protein TonB
MSYSLNQIVPKAQTPGPAKPGGRATLDLSVVMRQGDTGTTLGARAGADWGNELIAWVNQRKYYPRQAAENGEDGEVTVRVVVTPSGHVTSVDLARKSGSRWLDMALEAMFRDANLPPLHGETQPFGFTFTMVYILLPAR